ncbi:MAG: SMP-30/gluconolactonase/LRE family protein [Acidobacteria bacterium]|nr:SMP-30/gluconolactonase/LRE family protein [Acidobacteriota bacterium]
MKLFKTLFTVLPLVGLAAEGQFVRKDPAFDQLVPKDAKIEKLAGGLIFTEGPIWMPDGTLLFSDVPGNTIYRWKEGGKPEVFLKPSGYDGKDAPAGAYIGSNGLTLDKQGRLIICQHGNGQVVRREKDGKLTVLASKYEGKRLNSPNDAVYKSDGALYFTDPPYGFTKQDEDPKKEQRYNGVYRLKDGKLTQLVKEMTRPNGLAFSPDEKFLYIANSDDKVKAWVRYDVKPDGTLSAAGKLFYDVTKETADGAPDGMKVDKRGNIYATGPGGIWVFSPEGKHLGTIAPPEVPANCHWGGADGQTLYMTARTGVYRVRLSVAGIRP